MAANDDNAPIPSPVYDLVAIFEEQLSEVQFPNVNHQTLASLVEHVRASAEAVAAAQAQVATAEAALGDSRDELFVRAEQALAYAKIYAATDAKLLERLNGIELGKAQKKPLKAKVKEHDGIEAAPRKKGRKARAEPSEPSVTAFDQASDTAENSPN
jgi:hypothetical protein